MRTALCGVLWMMGVWVAPVVLAQATLPTAYTGPWERGTPPSGWTFAHLGIDYLPGYDGLNDGAAKLDGTGDSITISYNEPAAALTFWIQGNTFSGGSFAVEESTNGVSWTPIQTYTSPPSPAVFQSLTPAPLSRYIRFIYTLKVNGNVGIDGISVLNSTALQPEISDVAVGATADVTVFETVLGRTYVLDGAASLQPDPVSWVPVDSNTGTGSSLILQDAVPTHRVQFYRVRDITP